jgi:hypothetical protein
VLQVRQHVEGVRERVARLLLRVLLMWHGGAWRSARRRVLLLVACLRHHGPKPTPDTGSGSCLLLLLGARQISA